MVEFRPICLDDDRDFVLHLFMLRAFESASEDDRRRGLNEFRVQWLGSSQAAAWLKSLKASLNDKRTIADVVLVDGAEAGIVWATYEGPPYEKPFMELRMVALKLNFQRQGLGRFSVHHVEQRAAERGALSIRSTGTMASRGVVSFHDAVGFEPIQTIFEKRLPQPAK